MSSNADVAARFERPLLAVVRQHVALPPYDVRPVREADQFFFEVVLAGRAVASVALQVYESTSTVRGAMLTTDEIIKHDMLLAAWGREGDWQLCGWMVVKMSPVYRGGLRGWASIADLEDAGALYRHGLDAPGRADVRMYWSGKKTAPWEDMVYAEVRQWGRRGCTADDVKDRYQMHGVSTIDARFTELRQAGRLFRTGSKRVTNTGNMADVYTTVKPDRQDDQPSLWNAAK